MQNKREKKLVSFELIFSPHSNSNGLANDGCRYRRYIDNGAETFTFRRIVWTFGNLQKKPLAALTRPIVTYLHKQLQSMRDR